MTFYGLEEEFLGGLFFVDLDPHVFAEYLSVLRVRSQQVHVVEFLEITFFCKLGFVLRS